MNTLNFIATKYGLDLNVSHWPLEIPRVTRVGFADTLAELNMNRGAEIGVESGIYSEILLKANPNLTLYSIDAWEAYKGYRDHVTQAKLNGILEKAQARLEPFGFNSIIVKNYSLKAVKNFVDNSLDFVYIDANHDYQNVVNDVCEWTKKVRPGGIVAGHDYIKRKENGYQMHVPMAVNGYVESFNMHPFFVLGRRDDPSDMRDRSRSWFFIKP